MLEGRIKREQRERIKGYHECQVRGQEREPCNFKEDGQGKLQEDMWVKMWRGSGSLLCGQVRGEHNRQKKNQCRGPEVGAWVHGMSKQVWLEWASERKERTNTERWRGPRAKGLLTQEMKGAAGRALAKERQGDDFYFKVSLPAAVLDMDYLEYNQEDYCIMPEGKNGAWTRSSSDNEKSSNAAYILKRSQQDTWND